MITFLRWLGIVVVVILVGWSAYFFFTNRRLPLLPDVMAAPTQILSAATGIFNGAATEQLKNALTSPTASSFTNSLQQMTASGSASLTTKLGESVSIASSSPALPEKLLDYARYQYCKQVVNEWEKK